MARAVTAERLHRRGWRGVGGRPCGRPSGGSLDGSGSRDLHAADRILAPVRPAALARRVGAVEVVTHVEPLEMGGLTRRSQVCG